jgi:hypothetical protein
MLALVLKLFGSLVRYWVAVHVYGGVADAIQYHQVGADLARRFASGNFDTGLSSLSSTDFIRFFTGVVYTVTGPSIYAGFLLYSWLAFWGMFFLYQAFTIAVPDGNRRSYARLLFFLPSMLYWPSSIGKEAWMLFALGLAAKGTARLITGRTWVGLVLAGTGLWLATLVRPHVGGMAALGLLVAYLLARPPRRLGVLGAVMKLFGLAVLLVVAVVLLGQIQQYLLDKGIDPAEGVNSVLAESARRTSGGGSGFQAPSTSTSVLGLPYATVTILFRPFPQRPGGRDRAGEHAAVVPHSGQEPDHLAGRAPSPPLAVRGLRGRVHGRVRGGVRQHLQLWNPGPRAGPTAAVLLRAAGRPGRPPPSGSARSPSRRPTEEGACRPAARSRVRPSRRPCSPAGS